MSSSHHRGVVLCLERALKSANITPDQVSYINAHGTSTPAGDMAEYRAIRKVFKHDVSLNNSIPILTCSPFSYHSTLTMSFSYALTITLILVLLLALLLLGLEN